MTSSCCKTSPSAPLPDSEFEEARRAYQKAIDCDRLRPEPYAYLGQLYDHKQDYPQAARYYEAALQLRPQWQAVRYNLARAYLHQGADARAYQHYRLALEQNPQDVKAYNDLGTLYERWGQLQTAASYYREAIARQPDRSQAKRNLATLLLKQNRLQEAERVLVELLTNSPNSADLHHLLGHCDRLRGRLEEALAHYLQSLNLDPHQARVHEDLGKLFDRLKQPAAALICFKQAQKLNPQQLDLYGSCANMALQLERPAEAIAYWLEFLPQLPDYGKTWLEILSQGPIVSQEDGPPSDLYDRAFLARQGVIQHLMRAADVQSCQDALAELYRAWGDVRLEYGAILEAQTYYQLCLTLRPEDVLARQGLGASVVAKQEQEVRQKRLPQQSPQGWLPRTQSASARGVRCYDVACQEETDGLPGMALAETPQPPGQQLKACQGVNCQTCLNRLQEQFAPVALQRSQYHCPPGAKPLQLNRNRFTAEIAQGRVWTMPQTHWWQVCEAIAVMTRDDDLLADLSREYPGELPGCPNRHLNPGQHRIFNRVQLPPVEPIEGTVAVLTGLSANVYFHWMVDVLPRLDILRCSGLPEAEIDWFYVNSVAKPFQRQTLEQLGIPGDRILESDRHPHLQATRLVVPSFAGPIGWATGESIEFLRSQFLPSQPSLAPTSAKRLYISRQTAQYRRVINEPQLIQRLQHQGFQVIALEDYSVTEQAQLFANAEIIVAPHGAGLTNLVFCQPETTVIELFSPNYIRYYYWSICQYLQLNHYYLVGSDLPCSVFRNLLYPDVLTEDFWVDIEAIEQVIQERA
ncbi:glycosyltransferase 61 family protein [Sodalinema gerasimenkoae]|uniref:glycosyltransferase 61 family protein n=1 Tax=Sodalinema gerasimenkoae TaxID=2862348 RepID=UPI00135A26EE|nr:glycosyltransferase 61 family protein [Sodalinema gerasimenkoae]